jgi:type IV pilus assembly protein PilC
MELAMLLKAGIILSEGVLMLQDDEPDKNGKAVLQTLIDSLDKGAPLSEALRGSSFFPRYMVNMAEIGEKTGRLAETLTALSEYYDRQDRLAASIKNAVYYPVILLIMMITVVLILIIQVLPIFNDVFSRLGTRMSPLATNLMQFGGWLRGVSAFIAIIFGIILLIAFIAFAVPEIREGIVKAYKNRFGHRGIMGKIASSRFTSAMALATASGLDTEEAVEMAATISGGTKAIDEKNEKCVALLRSGGTLANAMRDSEILSARDSRMLSLGSRSGMTDTAMLEIARRGDQTVQEEIGRIVGRIEPTLVIITSLIVGIILLSVMLPLMGIMTSIG